MPSLSPRSKTLVPTHRIAQPHGDVIRHEVRIEGKLTGFWGTIAAIMFLMAVLVLGLITLTVAVWIACGVLLLAVVTVVLRVLTAARARRPLRQ